MAPRSSPIPRSTVEQFMAGKRAYERQLQADQLFKKIRRGDTASLSASITLVESKRPSDIKKAQVLLRMALPHSGAAVRIGITGVPGVGKSTFIEQLGNYLTGIGKKVAVLAIDPSSKQSGGAILGDKTRMTTLSRHPNVFIRPSATAGALGGVAQKTREGLLLCEAAGFEVILIETVGVGQSEVAAHAMTDFFLLLLLAGAGDELQGIKRGIVEMADALLITKADGDNAKMARLARAEYSNALHLFPPHENSWHPPVEIVSALEGKGIERTWQIVETFEQQMRRSGWWDKRRAKQQAYWMNATIRQELFADFYKTSGMTEKIREVQTAVQSGAITAFQASAQLMAHYRHRR